MTPEITKAVSEIQAAFPNTEIQVVDDNSGNIPVIIESIPLSQIYTEPTTWIGFTIPTGYPYPDIYPHYVRADLARTDGRPLGQGFHQNRTFQGRNAVMLSRRTTSPDPETETALTKLKRVILWLKSPT